ncbi:PIN domain-containing protein [Pyrodictium abyssi]|uniref:PIN domain-containing protein n=1 Tax=Pyrodictium abyssi TaxID=54256 RepID=UPI0030C66AD5
MTLIRNEVEPILGLFIALPITSEPREIIEVTERYGLMLADSIIALTCKYQGIDTMATLDRDFERIPWLRVIP